MRLSYHTTRARHMPFMPRPQPVTPGLEDTCLAQVQAWQILQQCNWFCVSHHFVLKQQQEVMSHSSQPEQ